MFFLVRGSFATTSEKYSGLKQNHFKFQFVLSLLKVKVTWRVVKYGDWWPILGICALHLTHPSAHTHSSEHTHTHREHTPGAVGSQWSGSSWGFGALLKGLTSVVVLRVERALIIHSPHLQSNLEPTTFVLQVQLPIH